MNIEQFKSSLKDAARANRFEVSITGVSDFNFLCKATTVPNDTIGIVDAPYQGRTIKLAGDRTYADWTVTVFHDNEGKTRREFYNWMQLINDPITNISADPSAYKRDARVTLLDRQGAPLKQGPIMLFGVFPTDSGSLDLDWSSNDTILEFTVTLAYDYHTF